MKFIFPQNYNFKNKIFGVIDYATAFINVLWCTFIVFFVNLIFNSINIKIFLIVILCFPLILFSFSGLNGENIIDVFIYMSKFILKQKLILFK